MKQAHKAGPPQRRPLGWQRVVWAAVAPFLAAALLGSLLFRAGGGSGGNGLGVVRHPARVLEETHHLGADCLGAGCPGHALAGAAAAAVAAEAGGSEPDGGGLPAAADLPKLFLFIGVLSGRGYRHRRLAVREAWSNKAQVPGQVVAKFILSEDERTPQVRGGAAPLAGGGLSVWQRRERACQRNSGSGCCVCIRPGPPAH